MSRIGKLVILIPDKVNVQFNDNLIKVLGPKGFIERHLSQHVIVNLNDKYIELKIIDANNKQQNALSGLYRTLIYNMVVGVSKGFEKKLCLEGVGYRFEINSNIITFSVGYSKPVDFVLPFGVNAESDKMNILTLTAIDNELLGQTAAKIRSIRKPEPYKGKGIRYVEEKVCRKVGKSSGKK